MTQAQMSKEEAEVEMLNWLEAEKDYKESKLVFGFTPELMLAIYINTFFWGKLNGSSLRSYYYHLMNIKNWLEEANYCIGDSAKKKKFCELATENVSKTNGKNMKNFYYTLENYTKAKSEVLAFDWIIDSLDGFSKNIEFTSDFVMTLEILVKDIQANIPKRS